MPYGHQEDALILMKAAKLCIKSFHQVNSILMVPSFMNVNSSLCLKMLINLLLKGSDIMDQDSTDSQPCLAIAQLVLLIVRKLLMLRKKLL